MENTNVLSFDIGVTNMAYCCIVVDEVKHKRISQWGCFSIKAKTLEAQTRKLIEHLDKLSFPPNTTVVIEKQPRVNARMRVLEGCLLMYFCLRGPKGGTEGSYSKVVTFSPHHKLKLYQRTEDEPELVFKLSLKSHYGRKKLGIEHCRRFLKRYNESSWITFFESHKKKDDLADSYLQGLSYIDKYMS